LSVASYLLEWAEINENSWKDIGEQTLKHGSLIMTLKINSICKNNSPLPHCNQEKHAKYMAEP
jgi:hypothetical protein